MDLYDVSGILYDPPPRTASKKKGGAGGRTTSGPSNQESAMAQTKPKSSRKGKGNAKKAGSNARKGKARKSNSNTSNNSNNSSNYTSNNSKPRRRKGNAKKGNNARRNNARSNNAAKSNTTSGYASKTRKSRRSKSRTTGASSAAAASARNGNGALRGGNTLVTAGALGVGSVTGHFAADWLANAGLSAVGFEKGSSSRKGWNAVAHGLLAMLALWGTAASKTGQTGKAFGYGVAAGSAARAARLTWELFNPASAAAGAVAAAQEETERALSESPNPDLTAEEIRTGVSNAMSKVGSAFGGPSVGGYDTVMGPVDFTSLLPASFGPGRDQLAAGVEARIEALADAFDSLEEDLDSFAGEPTLDQLAVLQNAENLLADMAGAIRNASYYLQAGQLEAADAFATSAAQLGQQANASMEGLSAGLDVLDLVLPEEEASNNAAAMANINAMANAANAMNAVNARAMNMANNAASNANSMMNGGMANTIVNNAAAAANANAGQGALGWMSHLTTGGDFEIQVAHPAFDGELTVAAPNPELVLQYDPTVGSRVINFDAVGPWAADSANRINAHLGLQQGMPGYTTPDQMALAYLYWLEYTRGRGWIYGLQQMNARPPGNFGQWGGGANPSVNGWDNSFDGQVQTLLTVGGQFFSCGSGSIEEIGQVVKGLYGVAA